jgi:uncharacterized membrane protein
MAATPPPSPDEIPPIPPPPPAAEPGTQASTPQGAAPPEAPADRDGDHGPVTPDALVDAVRGIEASTALDPATTVLEKVARAVAPPGPREDLLTGTWLGHALHPVLTDVPLGMWMSASLLDVVGGRSARRAAKRLVGVGVVTAVPTAATGLAEWLLVDRASQRVGVVHAGANSAGLALYTASWIARRRGHHLRGAGLGIAGGLAAIVGGYLGGHLAVARKAGTRDPRFAVPADG